MKLKRVSSLSLSEADFELRESYHKAKKLLELLKPKKARVLLEDISSKCRGIKYYSHIDYLYAFSYELEEKIEQRNAYLNSFIDFSQSIYPSKFEQVNLKSEEVQRACSKCARW